VKRLGLLVLLFAYALLIPGLTQPMLTISASVEKSALVQVGRDMLQTNPDTPALLSGMANMLLDYADTDGSIESYRKTRSILGTVSDLFDSHHYLVGFLIMLFSVIVPAFKGVMLLLVNLPFLVEWRPLLLKFSNLISKWSMADVFVIAIFVAYLAANAIKQEAGLMSFDAVPGSGFYFFLSYCLLSIFSAQLLGNQIEPTAMKPSTHADKKEEVSLD
jgi:uncharacterized paraquat-inducible protein A